MYPAARNASAPPAAIRRERARVAGEDWGARLLALQDAEGLCGGGLYNPKWISTTYTLVLLRSLGLAPRRGTAATPLTVRFTPPSPPSRPCWSTQRFRPARARETREAQSRGREFLLVHRLFRSHRTGKIVKPEMLRFVFPPRWHYDVLRGLDHFQDAAAPRDPRLADAIAVVEQRRQEDGRWNAARGCAGQPSRWLSRRKSA